jgi:polyketide biosynthesis acyl carrier protein
VTDDEIFDLLRQHIVAVLPEVDPRQLHPGQALRDLGANSIDRMDIVIGVQDELGVAVPSTAMAGVNNLATLVAVLRSYT